MVSIPNEGATRDDFDHLYLAHALNKPCSSTARKYALNNQVRLITRVYSIASKVCTGTVTSQLPGIRFDAEVIETNNVV